MIKRSTPNFPSTAGVITKAGARYGKTSGIWIGGTCKDCKWWEDEDTESFRICGKLRPPRTTGLANVFAIHSIQYRVDIRAGLETMADFGCVMWEEKDDTD